MNTTKPNYFFIDFDSTFVKVEGLDELAKVALKDAPHKEALLEKITTLTEKGMEGEMPFDKSLQQRILLFQANRSHIEKLVKILKKNISVSILRNKQFFKTYKDNIYIISGGFKEFIVPVVKPFGIREDHVFANTFIFNTKGEIIEIDNTDPLAHNDGKATVVKALQLKGHIMLLGDAFTDLQLKKQGLVDTFVSFTENMYREHVVKNADYNAPSFDEFLHINKLPLSVSYPKNTKKKRFRILY